MPSRGLVIYAVVLVILGGIGTFLIPPYGNLIAAGVGLFAAAFLFIFVGLPRVRR